MSNYKNDSISGNIYAGLVLFLILNIPLGQAQNIPRTSGTQFLSPSLQAMQSDSAAHPAMLWVQQGQQIIARQCLSCHAGGVAALKSAAASFPKMRASMASQTPNLISLEDQLLRCQQRSGMTSPTLESEQTLALSAALHHAAQGQPIAPEHKKDDAQWQEHLRRGRELYNTRMGRINLACAHCHDERIGAQMRGDVISPAHPTGFPIYRLAWQTLGSMERRLRACYAGVQAPIPAFGNIELRELELHLKWRAQGIPLEGPSIRR